MLKLRDKIPKQASYLLRLAPAHINVGERRPIDHSGIDLNSIESSFIYYVIMYISE